ncbi:MAG: cytochrome c biogenesis protein CcsA [Opitutales bacterium]|nr:cytochrome c biogenesis protein CcsA [Opitutales bacterium]
MKKHRTSFIGLIALGFAIMAPVTALKADAVPAWPEIDYAPVRDLQVHRNGDIVSMGSLADELFDKVVGKSSLSLEDGRELTPEILLTSLWLSDQDWGIAPLFQVPSEELREALGVTENQERLAFREVVENENFLELLNDLQEHLEEHQGHLHDELLGDLYQLHQALEMYHGVASGRLMKIVPHPRDPSREWVTIEEGARFYSEDQLEPLQMVYLGLGLFYQSPALQEEMSFGEAAQILRAEQGKLIPESASRAPESPSDGVVATDGEERPMTALRSGAMAVDYEEEKSGIPDWPELDLSEVETIIVQHGGRRKPMLTLANETMLSLSGRRALTIEGRRLDAMTLITGFWLGDKDWSDAPLILINEVAVKEALGLEVVSTTSRYSYREIFDNPHFSGLLADYNEHLRENRGEIVDDFYENLGNVFQRLQIFRSMATGSLFRVVPHPTEERGTWETMHTGHRLYSSSEFQPLRRAFLQLQGVYEDGGEGRSTSFAEAVGQFKEAQAGMAPDRMLSPMAVRTEILYETWMPYRWAAAFSFLSALLIGLSWYKGRRFGIVGGHALAVSALLLMILGMAARVIISGRAPVTNMYETVLWVAMGALLFALIFEWRYRARYFLVSAAPLAGFMLILSESAPVILDPTIAPLVPVLRDNFWLTTHVLTVTISYAAFALSFALGHFILGKQILKGGKLSINEELYTYIYRTLQIGVVLLLTGVLLGAVWANYSWGRFWDWDPKETASLVALLGYIAVLHGRFAGWWKGFGFTVGAVVGFQGIILCWYGVNFIWGAGLHSYGFGSGGIGFMVGFVLFEAAFVTLALLRRYVWTSPFIGSDKTPPTGGSPASSSVAAS